jgi:hydroxyacylglutathione hydrolase
MEPFEDEIADIIGKAQRGLEWEDPSLALVLGLDRQQLRSARRGELERGLLSQLAKPLKLSPAALLERLDGLQPPAIEIPDCLHAIVSNWGDMRVNAWLLVAKNAKEGLLFDTGAEIKPLQSMLERLSVSIRHLILTHTHGDHIALLDTLREKFPAIRIKTPAKEPIAGAVLINDKDVIHWGGWRIEAIATPGHSIGGTSYAIYAESNAAADPIAVVVGDALFAGSIGGIRLSAPALSLRETYENALQTIRTRLLCFNDSTLLLPGHGPATTVGWEKAHNPFLA